ncbi:hypothetical protein D3C87_1813180 [compost metagenome]
MDAFTVAHGDLSLGVDLDIVRVSHFTADVDRFVVEELNFAERNIGSFQVTAQILGENGVIGKRNGIHGGAGRKPAQKDYSYKKFFNQIHVNY